MAKSREGEGRDWVRFRFGGDLQTYTRIAPKQDERRAKKERQEPLQVSVWAEHPEASNTWEEADHAAR